MGKLRTVAHCQLETVAVALEIVQATGSPTSCLKGGGEPQNPPGYQWGRGRSNGWKGDTVGDSILVSGPVRLVF